MGGYMVLRCVVGLYNLGFVKDGYVEMMEVIGGRCGYKGK